MSLSRDFSDRIKTVMIKKTPSEDYDVSVLVESDIDSDGHQVENPRQLKKGLQRLGAIQKKLCRQKKGYSNRSKQKRLYEKVRNQRHDFIHQETAKLTVKNHATSFMLEDLNIMGMMKNRKLYP